MTNKYISAKSLDLVLKQTNRKIKREQKIVRLAVSKKAVDPFVKLGQLVVNKLAPMVAEVNKAGEVIGKTLLNVGEKVNAWWQQIDFSPLFEVFEKLSILSSDVIDKADDVYKYTLYKCHWFPYIGKKANTKIMLDIMDLAEKSNIGSKRLESRVDKIMYEAYSDSYIKALKKQWDNIEQRPYMRKILKQALTAHLRKEYVLTISCLTPLWERCIAEKMNVYEYRTNKEIVKYFEILMTENNKKTIVVDYFNKELMKKIRTKEDVKQGQISRHGVSHGWYNGYPNKKASINVIMVTDFILKLNPKELEEKN